MKVEISPVDPIAFAEIHALDELVDRFAIEMKSTLLKEFVEGKRGWNDHIDYAEMRSQVPEQVNIEHWVDVANLVMFLWNQEN